MSPPLDELYFVWLYRLVSDPKVKSPRRTHWRLCKKLYTTEFIWFVANDEARAEDGKDLRYEFLTKEGINQVDPHWMNEPCSMLELFIGLSRRLEFLTGTSTETWFWHLISTVDLHQYNDAHEFSHEDIDETIERIIWRTYRRNGEGGLFPLRKPPKDQRKVELWYQLNAYLIENY